MIVIVNRSDTHIDTGFGHLDQFETQNESFDSYNENKQNEEEEEYEDFSEANIIIRNSLNYFVLLISNIDNLGNW